MPSMKYRVKWGSKQLQCTARGTRRVMGLLWQGAVPVKVFGTKRVGSLLIVRQP